MKLFPHLPALTLAAFTALAADRLQAAPVPAFPGAQGYGATTPGGRGGRVIAVTNLNDSGPGSLREACNASGPRIVVFRVGGIITLNSHIYLANPNITIAGQTAPGGGILIRGSKSASPSQLQSLFYVETGHVVMQYLRMRLGYNPNFHELNGKNVILADKCHDIMVDHCSFSWAQDKNFQMWPFTASLAARNITLQWNIISEPVYANGADGTGLLLGGNSSEIAAATTNIDVHHNFFFSNRHRNPLFKANNVQVVNNLVYNWDSFGTGWEGGATLDIVGNKYKAGPMNQGHREIAYRPDGDRAVVGNPSVFIEGNIGPSNTDPASDNWKMIENRPTWNFTNQNISTSLRRTTKQAAAAIPIKVSAAGGLETLILPEAGASKRLDASGALVDNRDAVDVRVVQAYSSGGGRIISNETEVGGYPVIAAGTPYADNDGDGMADAWESAHGLNPGNAADASADRNGDGLTNIEEFLSGGAAGGTTQPPPTTNPDTDGDGIPDANEGGTTPYVVGVDDRLVDTDGDGVSNAAEYAAGTDPRTAPPATPPPTNPPPTTGILPAFPGAAGFGAETPGGRGGRVIEVTNLNDSGAGSLRAACQGTGPRIIVFRVSGTINLQSRILLTEANSFVTIAGQSAPGGGVQLKGDDMMLYGAHDVVIRHIRFRTGEPSSAKWSRNGLLLYGDSPTNKTHHVVVDHCSFYWGPSENYVGWDYVENVTLQRCISEGMVQDYADAKFMNSYGATMGTDDGAGNRLKNTTIHHCLLANSAQRNPLLTTDGPHHMINNVIYNWKDFGTTIQNTGTGTAVNLIGNVYKRGPASNPYRYAVGMDHTRNPDGYVYVRDNIGPFRPDATKDDWAIVGSGYNTANYWTVPATSALRRLTPWPASPVPVQALSSGEVVANVLADVGATKPLRDVVDQRIINDFQTTSGTIKRASAQQPSWWPVLASLAAPVDTDHDGMPDNWELTHGLNPNNAADGPADLDGNGYTNVEEYLNR